MKSIRRTTGRGLHSLVTERRSVDLGGITVDLLRIGTFRSDAGAIFGPVPQETWAPMVASELDARSRLLQALNILHVSDASGGVLLETGAVPAGTRVSNADTDSRSARDALIASGLNVERITTIVPSHLHRDHAGGLVDQHGAAAFPRAEIVAPDREIAAVASGSLRARAAYDVAALTRLFTAKPPRSFDGSLDLTPTITLRRLGGHTPGSQATIVRGRERTLLFLGDLFMRPWQANPRWVTSYDDEAWVSVDAKASIFAEAAAGEWLVAMSHEVQAPLGRITADAGRFRFVSE
jgi:glyoxylase-like metal-dependent hydrolase (beta-lactamase superfamily II)